MNSPPAQQETTYRRPRIVRDPAGGINITFFWREAMFGVQFDYPEDSRKQQMLNRLEDDALRRDGIEIMRVDAIEFDKHPDEVVARIGAALAHRTAETAASR